MFASQVTCPVTPVAPIVSVLTVAASATKSQPLKKYYFLIYLFALGISLSL